MKNVSKRSINIKRINYSNTLSECSVYYNVQRLKGSKVNPIVVA